MSWSPRKKKEGIFCTIYFVKSHFFDIILHIKKDYLIHFCFLFVKSSKIFSISLTVNAPLHPNQLFNFFIIYALNFYLFNQRNTVIPYKTYKETLETSLTAWVMPDDFPWFFLNPLSFHKKLWSLYSLDNVLMFQENYWLRLWCSW